MGSGTGTGDQAARAERFRTLHAAGGLLLPNAWDAISARVLADRFPAIATASASIAFARGYPDGERIPWDEMLAQVALITRQAAVPVSADLEAGFGPTPAEVGATVAGAIAAGAVGVNLEDARPDAHGATTIADALFPEAEAAGRIAAARAAGDAAGVPIVINARTDPFLLGLGADDDERVAIAVARGRAYLAAGADVIFVPGVSDPALVRRLVAGIGGPVSLMLGPGSPAPADLFAAGACRLSTGPHMLLAAMGALRRVATGLRDDPAAAPFTGDHLPFGEADGYFAPRA